MIKLHRSTPSPSCLEVEKQKANGDYKCGEVIERLAEDFKNKCYLCEIEAPTSTNVEHLVSHKGDKELKFDWNNLFLSCAHCNSVKGGTFDNILNCTKPDHDVENWIGYHLVDLPIKSVKITALEDTEIIQNTVRLLHKIYNGSTKQKTYESKNLKKTLEKELRDFEYSLLEYRSEKILEADKKEHLNNIKWHLSCASAFTAFKRWIVKDNQSYREEFLQYFD